MVRAPTKLDDVVAVDVRRRFVLSPSNREEQFRSIGIVQIGMCRLVNVVPSKHVVPLQQLELVQLWVSVAKRIRIPDPYGYMLNRYLARAYHIFLLGARAATSHKMSVVNLLYLIKNDTPGLKPQNDTQPI